MRVQTFDLLQVGVVEILQLQKRKNLFDSNDNILKKQIKNVNKTPDLIKKIVFGNVSPFLSH